jgi:glycosyltransferase involved in cell wall biosynthesis
VRPTPSANSSNDSRQTGPADVKIIFDCRFTKFPRHDGISRYTAGLVEAFSKLHPVTMLIHDERQLAMLPDLPWIKSRPGHSLLEPFIPLFALNREKPDIVFCPMQTIGSTGHRGYRLVLTVHDMVFYRTRTPPKEFSPIVRAIWFLYHLAYWPERLTLNRADAVVTGSYNCEREMNVVHLTTRPLVVIRPGIEDSGLPPRTYPLSTADGTKSLVYMGTFMPNKNVETLAKAMHLLPGYTLRLLSRISDETRERIAALAPAGSIRFDNGVTDEEYLGALLEATAMVSACRDEGFGIPLIEGLNSGTPLVISDIPVFKEVGGDAAVFFNQESPEAFAAAVRSMDEPGEWMSLSARAREHALEFSWEKSGRQLFDLFTTMMAGGPVGRGARP